MTEKTAKTQAQIYREKNPDYFKNYYKNNTNKFNNMPTAERKEYMRKFRKNNPNYYKEYYKKNAEKILKSNRKSYHRNKKSKRKTFYQITVDGQTFKWNHKKDIPIERVILAN